VNGVCAFLSLVGGIWYVICKGFGILVVYNWVVVWRRGGHCYASFRYVVCSLREVGIFVVCNWLFGCGILRSVLLVVLEVIGLFWYEWYTH